MTRKKSTPDAVPEEAVSSAPPPARVMGGNTGLQDPPCPEGTDPEVWALELRVQRGIDWLVEHDPGGVFHLWFQAGLLPISPLGTNEHRRGEWVEYQRQRQRWERLSAQLTRVAPEVWGPA